jgi:MFS transporter, FHS family, L-fucose permease
MKTRNYYMVGIVFITFFVISFITNILGALIPEIQHSFQLSYAMVAFLPFSFFIAYGVMSIPAGMFIEAYGEKKAMLLSFAIAFFGAGLLSLFAGYAVSLISLFLIGIGMAMLQVVINPLLRISGGEEHFAFNSVLAQLLFGLASFVSPRMYTYIEAGLQQPAATDNGLISALRKITNPAYTWTSVYWVFMVAIFVMIVILVCSRFPKVVLTEDEKSGTVDTHIQLIKRPVVILFFLGIFCYVGLEQGISDWMSEFLHQYHGYNTLTDGSSAVSWFWGLMTVGCALNLLLLKLFDSRKLLVVFAVITTVVLAIALWGPARYSMMAFPALGFTISIMFSVIFSLALNSLSSHHGSFSGILCTGILGGAAVPLLIGWLADHIGLRAGMYFLFIILGYILSIGIWAKPLINNKTIQIKPE